MHGDWECMRVHMPDILPITTSASPDNIMQISAHTNANLITLPGILDIASLFQMCKEESERAHTLILRRHNTSETTNPQSEQQACQSKLGWHMFNSWTSQLPTTLSRRHIPWHHFQILLRQATLVLVSGYACASQLSCEAHECKPETCCDSDAF